jgi:hypothetical protein
MKRFLAFIVLALSSALMIASFSRPLWAQNSQDQADDQNGLDQITIPEGTEFKLQLHTSINTKTSKAGDRVITTLLDPVTVEDTEVLPKGVRIDGHLGEVKAAGRRGKGGYLSIIFDNVTMPNGEKLAILGSLTEVFSSESGSDPNVGPEGDLKAGGANRKKQMAMFVAPAAAGAAAGGLAGGIAAGAAGAVAALIIPKGKEAALKAGSLIGMRLDQDVTVTLPPDSQK